MEQADDSTRLINERLLPCYEEKIKLDNFSPYFIKLIENIK